MTTQAQIEQPLPSNAEAERAVLAAILLGTKGRDVAFDLLAPEHFFVPQNQRIFRSLAKLREAGKCADALMLDDEIRRSGELEAAGGSQYIMELIAGVPQVSNVEHYVRLVREKSLLRRVIYTATEIQQDAFSSASAGELLDRVIEKLSELARTAEEQNDLGVTCRDAAAALLQSFDAQDSVRIFTDVDELDRLTGGFRAGELVIFTAETGVGKTLLAQQTRRRSCRDGRHTLYCSGEMSAPHLISRELATEAGVEHWKMRRPERITPEETRALTEAASHECQRCRILDGELSVSRIRRVARQMKSRAGIDSVIVDYDELVEAPGKDEFEQQRNLVRSAKSLAMELKCPVILISQLRKSLQGEDRKRPNLQRLYGSGAKAKHSSIVIYVDREYVQELCGDETVARIVVVKNRDGKVGALDAFFNVKTLRFESVQTPQPEQPDWVTR
ncbi:MAG TPA: replicative DNA helicase [Candidatus Dormibacteraeota bacterium]|nr:replicative DNA helicase [Candidatus Dormibacteraeota bacterium]